MVDQGQRQQSVIMSEHCLLTGRTGRIIETRQPDELADSYRTYLGHPLPTELITKYFLHPVNQLECAESGLRWFTPAIPAEHDFYEHLGNTYDWYYENSWAHYFAIRLLKKLGISGLVDIGCGSGSFLKLAAAAGLSGAGIDINVAAVQQAQREGLQVFLESELPTDFRFPELICMIQTLEHVADPLQFLRHYAERSGCRRIFLAMPCFESLLGFTSDPLSYPPHHVSFWSEKSIHTLAAQSGFRVSGIWRQPLRNYKRFRRVWGREQGKPLPESEITLADQQLASWWHFLKSRLAGRPWAVYEHTIAGLLER